MKQVIEELKSGKVKIIESPLPRCGANDVLVHNRASLISPGTEKMMIELGKKSLAGKALARPDLVRLAYDKAKREGFISVFKAAMARLDTPMPLGYSSAGTIASVGKNVQGFSVGDEVACAGAAYANHAEFVAVPQELAVRLDPQANLSHEEAAFVMLGGIAMHGFRSAELSFGETVVVVGLGLIGLITVQIARAYGCEVVGIDVDPTKVAMAKKLGCVHAMLLGKNDIDARVLNLTNGRGADGILLTAATKDNGPILLAERLARTRARIVLVGVSEITLTRKMFWDKELVFTVSKASGPSEFVSRVGLPAEHVRWTERRNHEEFVRLLERQSVNVKDLISHRMEIADALKAYDMIMKGRERYIGVILRYPQESQEQPVTRLRNSQSTSARDAGDRKCVGLIGAGMFTRNVLWPVVAKTTGIKFAGVAASTGVNAQHVGERYGFEYVATDYTKLLADDRIGSVFVTTRHNLHAEMIRNSLKAGKNVFVEKPLAITSEEVDQLVKSYRSSDRPIVMVGFNRRYAPLSREIRTFLEGRTSPVQALFRVNASFIPPDHWTQDPAVGGGRIIGEVCHFVDYLQFVTQADPIAVTASSIDGSIGKFLRDDNVSLSVEFSDGSLGTILYTALGSKGYSRERVEVYCEESVAILDEFRTLDLIRGAKKVTKKLGSQDLGYRAEVDAFFAMESAEATELFRQAVLTTRTTIAALESLRTKTRILVPKIDLAQ